MKTLALTILSLSLSACAYQMNQAEDSLTRQIVLSLGAKDQSSGGPNGARLGADPQYIQKGLNQFWNSPTTMGVANLAGSLVGAQMQQQFDAEKAQLQAEIETLKARIEELEGANLSDILTPLEP